jgi:hypothetical protein
MNAPSVATVVVALPYSGIRIPAENVEALDSENTYTPPAVPAGVMGTTTNTPTVFK